MSRKIIHCLFKSWSNRKLLPIIAMLRVHFFFLLLSFGNIKGKREVLLLGLNTERQLLYELLAVGVLELRNNCTDRSTVSRL